MDLNHIRTALAGHSCAPVRDYPPVRAAVLLPLVADRGELSLLFEERNASIPQGGEICFPGGHVEAGERPDEAALRETAEELLLDRERIELVSPLHLLSGERGREIYSFLGVLHGYEDTWEKDEVSRAFLLPLRWFREHPPEIHECKTVVAAGEDFPYDLIPGGRDYPFAAGRQRMYFYRSPEGVIWGLTAKLLWHFLRLLESRERTMERP